MQRCAEDDAMTLDRRQFLKVSALSLAGAGLATLPGAVRAALVGSAAPFPDYKAMVCVFLFGGNDSFNMIVPRSQAEYDVYARSRQNLAIARDQLLAIEALTSDGAQYGLHPSMPAMVNLFQTGKAAVIANVGSLIQPTTRTQFLSGSVPVPPQLFSHNDQQDQWHTLNGRSNLRTGWAGRIADLLASETSAQQVALNISVFGNTPFQGGAGTEGYTLGTDGAPIYFGLTESAADIERRHAFERLLDHNWPSSYSRAFASVQRRALRNADIVNAALSRAPVLATPFPASLLAQQLAVVARMIAVRDELNMSRQIFFVAAGGFDTHDAQVPLQPGLMQDVSESIAAFHAATVELGIAERVTTFTQSDFGRTLTSNGDGTDHGWGGHQLVVGGAVRGREIYGRMPRLEIGGPDDASDGRIIPTLAIDQYAATLARWFGVPDAQLGVVAPNLGNFAQRDLGFLA
jgi:uncharacterized protein (DUF1501 family)